MRRKGGFGLQSGYIYTNRMIRTGAYNQKNKTSYQNQTPFSEAFSVFGILYYSKERLSLDKCSCSPLTLTVTVTVTVTVRELAIKVSKHTKFNTKGVFSLPPSEENESYTFRFLL